MSSQNLLDQLRRLNSFSSEFHDQLCNVLYGREYRQSVQCLQGDDLVWFVEYLNKVRCRNVFPHSPIKSVQALDSLNPASFAFRECLRELRSICGNNGILPTSYFLSSLLNIDSDPFCSGGYGDMYEGSLDGSRVCVKRVRVYTKDDPKKAAKVRYRHRCFPCLPSITKLIGFLSRGRNVETLNTPKHPTSPGCHYRSPPAYYELDVRRGPAGVHRETLQCRPT